MEILNTFGFEPVFFAAQIVNFLILAVIFKKFLYKPILKTLKDRQRAIAKGIEDAEKAALERDNAQSEKDAIIKAAGKEAEKILESTKNAADEIKQNILSEAKKEAEKIIITATKQADIQMETMEKRVKAASLDNSVAILEKVLSNLFTKNEKEKILERSMEKLKKYD